jgi:uncharacterized membrane protein YdjX (TVP38/TMEM64 family)
MLNHPFLVGIVLLIAASLTFAAVFFGGRAALRRWDEAQRERQARIAEQNRRRYSLEPFKGTKASQWQR